MNLASILNTTTPLCVPSRNVTDRQGLHADMVRYAAAMLYAEHLRSSLCSRVEGVIPVKAHDRVLIENIHELINPSDSSVAIAKAGCILKAHPPQVAEHQKTAESSATALLVSKSTVLSDVESAELSPIHTHDIENAAFSFAAAFRSGNASTVTTDVDATQTTSTTPSPRNLKRSLSSDTSDSTLIQSSSSSSVETGVSSRPSKLRKMGTFSTAPTGSIEWRVIQYRNHVEPSPPTPAVESTSLQMGTFSTSTDSTGRSVVKYINSTGASTPQAPDVQHKRLKRSRSDESEDSIPTASTSSESNPPFDDSSRPAKIQKMTSATGCAAQDSPSTPTPTTISYRKVKSKVALSPTKDGVRRSSARLAASRKPTSASKLTCTPRSPAPSVPPVLSSPRASPSAAGDGSLNWQLSTRRAENDTFRIILRPSP
ncbi:hypothetical protein HYPSUDRAFT_79800 [Hypholoma sublateritium FD-334 SS-4]|uniref:Uncharacterized protein n=1 Tax=Hypholoma sublateritium (strain FD-334 SS-4) TaxID=945553 RepID=A0A0D2M230_HYPSF|nr:hypothetical protein HYPSUDRAFT_79800 [Hypholoma sublateritium FD-334 SS-4]